MRHYQHVLPDKCVPGYSRTIQSHLHKHVYHMRVHRKHIIIREFNEKDLHDAE